MTAIWIAAAIALVYFVVIFVHLWRSRPIGTKRDPETGVVWFPREGEK